MLALAAAWGIYSSLSTGITQGELCQYEADREPVGFFMVVLGKFLALFFCFAIVLHAVGLLAVNPITAIKQMLPWLPNP
ncbi:MAG: hypothetical protein KGK01_06535 [Bradyrhizobium sp.]|uniref:hypothetical protein n=1 Tax=Bradyrhizobium sp. TaxID=376 RepID=UPI00238F5A04|nr:hypothetical protein [Bradyrhizobium sp.]MDE2068959.1 hypothetical protein [Bradyrhizobium sp.]MDE2242101.1 hypothetical protein [Bradyrhizobium sp.]MDE2473225.1 hypothetical protein [Bradyrhizobium sp.]